jgi:hypothetical protein
MACYRTIIERSRQHWRFEECALRGVKGWEVVAFMIDILEPDLKDIRHYTQHVTEILL